MFGYVKPFKPNLRICEFEMYRGVYCALCKTLGKEYGILSRFTLNYDFSFLAMFHMAVSPECPGFERQRCLFNPLKKCTCCKQGGEPLSFAAAAAMLMVYYKLRDNCVDNGFLKSIPSRLLLPIASAKRKKAAKRYPELAGQVQRMSETQFALEQDGCRSIDRAAEPTALLLSYLCMQAVPEEDTANRRILERFGYCLGRWIYLIDAADDLQKDQQSGGYNPILLSKIMTDEAASLDDARRYAGEVLNRTLNEAAAAYELLSLQRFQPIISNIIYEGLPFVQKQAVKTKGKKA